MRRQGAGSDKTVVIQTLGLFNVKVLHLILKASLRELFIVKSQRTTPKTSANKFSTKPEVKYSVGCKACVWPRSSVSLLHLSHHRSGWPPTRSWWSFLERRCLWEPNQTVYTDGISDISRVPQIRKIHNALKFKNTARRFSICSENSQRCNWNHSDNKTLLHTEIRMGFRKKNYMIMQ